MIEIYPADSARAEPGDNRLAGWRHLALRVDSIEIAREALIRQGVIFEESSLSLNGPYSQDVADGGTYTPEAWRDALIGLTRHCSTSFPTSRCMQFMNFIRGGQSYLYDVSNAISAVPHNQACMSGPDLLPNNTSLFDNQNSVYEVLSRHTREDVSAVTICRPSSTNTGADCG